MARSIRKIAAGAAALLAVAAPALAQAPRPMSADGSAHAQVLGKWTKPDQPAFTLGREVYTGGKWIEILYGRPLARERDLFGSGDNYGKAALVGAPVWRAGANVSTRLRSEVPLVIGGKTVPAGEHTMFIELKPSAWTLIVSSWPAQDKYDPNNKAALWGAYEYTPDRDIVRVKMNLTTLPYSVEELTWGFIDMTNDGGKMAVSWGKSMASVPFKASAQ